MQSSSPAYQNIIPAIGINPQILVTVPHQSVFNGSEIHHASKYYMRM